MLLGYEGGDEKCQTNYHVDMIRVTYTVLVKAQATA